MPHGGQYDIVIGSRMIPNEALATSPVTGYTNGVVFTIPLNEAAQFELLSLSISSYQAVVDASDVTTLDVKTVTAAGGAGTTLVDDYNLEAVTALNGFEMWRGSSVMTGGMSLVFEVTATTPDTAGFGYCITYEGRIIERSGS